ncbi:hypothetical protein SEA_PUREGLOBE5_105 [Arthrobacter phage Pureglobe5]|nr:hypothetical protein SEA_PUREGLOBE5_105 [Arthrobacter phage Pureglobe5]
MGYDMNIEGEMPEAERIAKEAADAEWNEAIRARDAAGAGKDWPARQEMPEYIEAQKVALAAFEKMSRADTHYFRLNIWGMGRCRAAMYAAGMIFDGQEAEFPKYDPPTSAEGGAEALVAAEDAYAEEYDRLCEPVRAAHPEGGDTIPSFKFGSNDGWLVTESECAAAVKAWREHKAKLDANDAVGIIHEGDEGADEVAYYAEWWPEWIEFLERASQRGGFKVW